MRLAKKYFHLKSNAVYNSSAKNEWWRAKLQSHPFTIDCINELTVQLDYNIEKQTKYHIRRNEVMENNF